MTADPRPLILHVIHHLVIGGMENGLVNLINRMAPGRLRHAVACIEDYSEFSQRITRPNTEVFALHRSRIGVWKMRQKLFQMCRRLQPEVVHSRNLSGLDALAPAKLAGVRHCVHSEHGWDMGDLDGRRWRPATLRRLHSPLVDRYVTVSKDLERYLVERVGIAPARISQIYNGVDTERFAPHPDKSAAALPAELCGNNVLVIGTVGRIQPVKDQITLLKAFAGLVQSRAQFTDRLRLAIIGDGPLLGDLRQLSDTLGIAQLTWLPGAIGNIPDVLRCFDLFVLPSLTEGISNTVLEAMASGIPVIATAAGGNLELVEDGRCGRLFPPGDTAMLVRLLAGYVADPLLRQEHGAAARRVAVERFGLDAMIRQYEEIYLGLSRRRSIIDKSFAAASDG
jgi:sugar transferase (PEP-CTERM/EpsH1 system associated)